MRPRVSTADQFSRREFFQQLSLVAWTVGATTLNWPAIGFSQKTKRSSGPTVSR